MSRHSKQLFEFLLGFCGMVVLWLALSRLYLEADFELWLSSLLPRLIYFSVISAVGGVLVGVFELREYALLHDMKFNFMREFWSWLLLLNIFGFGLGYFSSRLADNAAVAVTGGAVACVFVSIVFVATLIAELIHLYAHK
jgi:hypothetical protein